MVLVCRRMYTFQASEPLSRPPPVSFSPPKAPPISAPEVPMFTAAIPQSDPDAERNCSTSRMSVAKIEEERPCGTSFCSAIRSEEHTSELQSLMRISYAVFCLKKTNKKH